MRIIYTFFIFLLISTLIGCNIQQETNSLADSNLCITSENCLNYSCPSSVPTEAIVTKTCSPAALEGTYANTKYNGKCVCAYTIEKEVSTEAEANDLGAKGFLCKKQESTFICSKPDISK